MRDFSIRFKIPTFLGLGIIIFGIAAGVYLTLREQNLISEASPNVTPQNITVSNISDDSVTISWQTLKSVSSYIKYGQRFSDEQTILDDRDTNTPKPHPIHYVTIKKLHPKTEYQFKIISGRNSSDVSRFKTAAPLSNQTGFGPIIGSVLDGDKPLSESIAYLSISDAPIQSALIQTEGNFLIPLSQLRKSDFSDAYPLSEGLTPKVTIVSEKGTATMLFKLSLSTPPLPPMKLGQDQDITTRPLQTPEPTPTVSEIKTYDLNGDGKINANDNAIVLQNFGKNPKNKKADLNSDGVVDQKDLDLMSKQINQ